MKKLYILTAILLCAATLQAASLYYQFPDATQFKNDDRLLIYQNASGSRNLTGAGLKSVIYQTAWPQGSVKVFQATSSSITSNQLVSVVRNRRGVITHMRWESGSFYMGVPGYNHTYIYPFNGMTNVSRTTPLVVGSYWLTRGVIGQGITIQGGPSFTPKALKYVGKVGGLPNFDFIDYITSNQTELDAWYWGTNTVGTLAANTTYTIRSDLAKEWGAVQHGLYSIGSDPCTYTMSNTSSAKVMINYSTVLCRSTFRTGSL